MKKILFCIGCILMMSLAHAQRWPGRFNNQGFGNSFNNQWGTQFGNIWNQSVYSYNYNGFSFNNNGVNLSVSTPWSGGSLSFPISSIQNGGAYAYTPPAPNRTYYNYNNATSSYGQGFNYSYQKTNRRRNKISGIDYSDPDLAINKSGNYSSTIDQPCTKTLYWKQKMVPVSIRSFSTIGSDGSVYQKTEVVKRLEWVLE